MTECERLYIETIVRDVLCRVVPGMVDDRLEEIAEEQRDAEEWKRSRARAERRKR